VAAGRSGVATSPARSFGPLIISTTKHYTRATLYAQITPEASVSKASVSKVAPKAAHACPA